jgi:hypothetical protein
VLVVAGFLHDDQEESEEEEQRRRGNNDQLESTEYKLQVVVSATMQFTTDQDSLIFSLILKIKSFLHCFYGASFLSIPIIHKTAECLGTTAENHARPTTTTTHQRSFLQPQQPRGGGVFCFFATAPIKSPLTIIKSVQTKPNQTKSLPYQTNLP